MSKTVEIAGPLKNLEFPPVCANCGNATSESLQVAKVFVRGDPTVDRRINTYPIVRVDVPFCPPCLAQHAAEARPIGGWRRFGLSFHNGAALAALGALGVGLLFVYETTVLIRSRSLLLELAAVCFLLAWGGFRIAYFYTERLAIPPLTSITSAFDFTDSRNGSAREHRTVFLRNPVFADAFLARNAARIWQPDDPANQASGWQRFFR